MNEPPPIVLTGATASGKSAVALLLAERLGAELISADSMQVYRGMDIGTGKPSPEEQRRVPHHVIDVIWPWESWSAKRFVELAEGAIADIRRRGRIPLVVGGTVLYLRALTEGLFEGPGADWDLRNRLITEAERLGTEHLHRRLAELDPVAADAIHTNDLRRIVRALEVFEKTGRPISDHQRQWRRGRDLTSASEDAYSSSPTPEARPLHRPMPMFILDRDRADLYSRIDRRVDAMMAAGWLDETRRLLADPRGLSREASQALGYRDLADHLAGRTALPEAVELVKRHTRQFAKRQLSWFRRFPDATWLRAASDEPPTTCADRVMAALSL